MALVINTNIASLNAQRNLSKVQTPLITAMQRLSSTLRINGAKDDAAGLAIATRMLTQARGLAQAVRNANDGISVAQTAEGAIDEITNAVERMRELAVQSAHGTYTAADRASMNAEFSALKAEIQRIASQTKFNDTLLLDGSFSRNLQVGYEANQVISLSVTNMKATALAGTTYEQTLSLTSGLNGTGGAANNHFAGLNSAGALQITVGANTYNVRATTDNDDPYSYEPAGATGSNSKHTSAIAVAAAINELTSQTGVTATATAATFTTTGNLADVNIDGSTNRLVINGQSVTVNLNGGSQASNAILLQNAINNQVSGVTASVNGTNNIVLTAADGRNITITATAGTDNVAGKIFGQTGAITDVVVARGGVKLNSQTSYTTEDAVGIENQISGEGAASATQYTLNALGIDSQENANTAMTVLMAIRNVVVAERGNIGAVQNRLESTVKNLENVVENVRAARSRIMDADFAAETANLTKSMIMQQAGISVLSQANTLPQNVLALLGGR